MSKPDPLLDGIVDSFNARDFDTLREAWSQLVEEIGNPNALLRLRLKIGVYACHNIERAIFGNATEEELRDHPQVEIKDESEWIYPNMA